MSVSVLTASRGTFPVDGTTNVCEVVWPIPVGTFIQALLWTDVRYLATGSPVLSSTASQGVLRAEIPGSGPTAQDYAIPIGYLSFVQRANGEREATNAIFQVLPLPADLGFAPTQISLRWVVLPDQPTDKTAGLTANQRLFVIV